MALPLLLAGQTSAHFTGRLLRKSHGDGGHPNTVLAIRLLLLTGARTGELRVAKPEPFDLELCRVCRMPLPREGASSVGRAP